MPVPPDPSPLLSLHSLLSNSRSESDRLFTACTTHGFLHLDLTDHPAGRALLETVDPVFGVAERACALRDEEKRRFDRARTGRDGGYKSLGGGMVDARGTRDRNEYWVVGVDDVLGVSSGTVKGEKEEEPYPPSLMADLPTLKAFITRCHDTVVAPLLAHLDAHLHLPPGTLLAQQRQGEPSTSIVRLIRSPPPPADALYNREDERDLGAEQEDVTFTPHTDIGSLTVLFSTLPGLQFLPPDSSSWTNVPPRRGAATINVGDALALFSGGVLRSGMHRVVAPPGQRETRWSVAYFSRVGGGVRMRSLMEPGEEGVSAEQWVRERGRRIMDGRSATVARS